MFDGRTPSDIVNRVFDSLGRPDLALGPDLQDGSEGAQPALRAYVPALQQLLRCAHWDFARKQAPMTLLADATGQTANVGTVVPAPWVYEYAYPIDSMKVRFVPWNTANNQQINPPPLTGLGSPNINAVRLIPAPYLEAMDNNYPMVTGGPPSSWDQYPEWWNVAGGGPEQRVVILTNVQTASAVYTSFAPYPSMWDPLFEEALVRYLAQQLVMPLYKGKDHLPFRDRIIASCKELVREARVVNGNEAGQRQTTDHVPDWIRGRNAGPAWGVAGYGYGYSGWGWGASGWGWGSYSTLAFANGTVF